MSWCGLEMFAYLLKIRGVKFNCHTDYCKSLGTGRNLTNQHWFDAENALWSVSGWSYISWRHGRTPLNNFPESALATWLGILIKNDVRNPQTTYKLKQYIVGCFQSDGRQFSDRAAVVTPGFFVTLCQQHTHVIQWISHFGKKVGPAK